MKSIHIFILVITLSILIINIYNLVTKSEKYIEDVKVDDTCVIIGKFCDLDGSIGNSLQKGFETLCPRPPYPACWDCETMTEKGMFPPPFKGFPKVCIKGTTCTTDRLCEFVGDMWGYLKTFNDFLSLCLNIIICFFTQLSSKMSLKFVVEYILL